MNFVVRKDQTSAQYTLRTHPDFWVRVERPTAHWVTIAAAYQGNLTDRRFGEAIAEILGNHVDDSVVSFRFADIAPSATSDMSDKQVVGQQFDLLSNVVRSWAKGTDREILDSHLDIEGGTYAAVFRLAV